MTMISPIDEITEQNLEDSRRANLRADQLDFYIIVCTLSVLAIIFSVFFRVPILIPTPWITAIVYVYMAPIFLYAISALVRPWLAAAICLPCLILGEILWSMVYGSAGELLLNVIMALNVRGIGCLLISIFRERGPVLAMLLGGVWGFVGYLVPATVYYTVMLSWSGFYMIAYSVLSTLVGLILIPAALLVFYVIQNRFKIRDLEVLLHMENAA